MLRSFSGRQRWWIAALQVVLLLAMLITPVAAASDPTALTGPQLIQLLQSYGIVKGDDQGNLNLEKSITRAEMITIMARSIGGERDAGLFKGMSPFSDTKGHWAESYVAYASVKGLVKGDGNGTVRPNDPISYAEALTMILRVIGKEPTTGDWPTNVLLASAQLGLVPAGIDSGNIRQNAVRGLVFQSLAQAISTVRNAQGKTALQTYIDSVPPTLTLDQPPASTKEATVRISGRVQDAISVMVNDKKVTVANGSFSDDVSLVLGSNKIVVTAMDLAGNVASSDVSITRVPPISTLDIVGPAKVRPGSTQQYTVTAKDADGKVSGLTGVTTTVSGNIGSFNVNTGILTASTTPAKGKITITAGQVSKSIDVEVMGQAVDASRLNIRSVNNGVAVSYTKPMTVAVEVQNSNGQFIDSDYGRPVSLTAAGLAGLTVSPAVAYTEGGIATFTVRSAAPGIVSFQATSASLTGDVRTAEFATNLRIRLTADQPTLMVGGTVTTSRIRATLVDENGAGSINQSDDIVVQLSATGTDGTLTNSVLRIPRGASSSISTGYDAIYSAGSSGGTAYITGTVTAGQRSTVDPLNIAVTVPTIDAGAFWDVLAAPPYTPNQQGTFYVRLSTASGSTIPGSYAFQLQLSTSNNEPKVNGIPNGVSVTLGSTSLNPVTPPPGSTNSNAVVVRTVGGVATFKITYDKPGQVYVTIVPIPGASTAYASDGTTGSAAYTGVSSRTVPLTFGGTATSAKLTVDSDGLGSGQVAGATNPSTSKAFTLHAYLTNANGYWIPGSSAVVTLTKVSGNSTTTGSNTVVTAVDGKADFTVYASATPGEDVYKVTTNLSGSPASNTVTLQVQGSAPSAPTIVAVRGSNNGAPGSLNYVNSSDTGLEIELAQDVSQHYVQVKVFQEGNYAPLYSSGPVDMTAPAPRVVVPKASLPSGVSRLQVVLHNGYGDSPRSVSSSQVTNAVMVTNVTLANAKFQRSNKTLTISGSGFTGSNDTVNPALITIRDASTGQSVNLAGALVTYNSYSQLTLNLTGLPAATALENPSLFSGNDVTLTAGDAWYTRFNGEQASANNNTVLVTPMANIRNAMYDRVNSRLYLVGDGLSTVNLDFNKLKLAASGASDILLSGLATTRISDNQWAVTLPSSVVLALDSNAGYQLVTLDGWAYDGAWVQTALAPRSIYAQVTVTGVSYSKSSHTLSLRGGGFTNGMPTIENITITDKTTNQSVTLSGTYQIINDGQIDFVLDGSATSVLEDTTKFRTGDDIYVTASTSWFTNAAGRPAADIPDRILRLSM